MPRFNKEEIDRFFDYGIFVKERILWLGSLDTDDDDEETGVDYEMCSHFIKGLTFLARLSEEPITIQMNNVGGDWHHGMAIYDAIRACRCHVTIVVYGYACSMGSIILQAADYRVLTPDCVVMIHDGKDALEGTPKTIRAWQKYGDEILQRMYSIYLKRIKAKKPKSKWTLKKIESLCSHDKIFKPEDAVDIGLADVIMDLFEIDDKPRGR